jgi:outer membrane lipoprotein carrier protein
MKSYITSTLAIAAGLVAAPALLAQSPSATLDRAIAAYAKVKTVRATFSQTITNPLMGNRMTASGEVQQRRPGFLSVRFTDPAGDRIVADGKHVWLYLPSTAPGQVLRTRLDAPGAAMPDVTAQFLDAPKSRYTVADAGRASAAGRPAHALTLVPKDESLPFARATIWVDDEDALVRQFETADENGVVRRVTITKLAINVPVEESAFRFTPPRGVRVVDAPGPAR